MFSFKKIYLMTNKKVSMAAYICLFLPVMAFADSDPASRAASRMEHILFGGFGTSLCSILVGATFIMAKTGKITWDRFMFIGFCTAGFLGSSKIVNLISGWVN